MPTIFYISSRIVIIDYTSIVSNFRCIVWYILCHNATRTDSSIISYYNTIATAYSRTNVNIVTDGRRFRPPFAPIVVN